MCAPSRQVGSASRAPPAECGRRAAAGSRMAGATDTPKRPGTQRSSVSTRGPMKVTNDTNETLARATRTALLFRLPNYSDTERITTRVTDPYTERRRARSRRIDVRDVLALQECDDPSRA